MTTSRFFLAFLAASVAGCFSGEGEDSAAPAAESSAESEVRGARGACLLAVDHVHYAADRPNVGRELAESVGASLVKNGETRIPGVLRASASTSPYTFAATVSLGVWSRIGTDSWDGSEGGGLRVWIHGERGSDAARAAEAVFEAMVRADETRENGAVVRRSHHGSVVCAKYEDGRHQCALGPLSSAEPTASCPR